LLLLLLLLLLLALLQDGCHSCYNSRSPDSCMDCLRNSSLPCHRCPAEVRHCHHLQQQQHL
jgi:hypothetical protein